MKLRLCLLAGTVLFSLLAPPVFADDDKKDDKKDKDDDDEISEITNKDDANFSIDKLVGGKEVWAMTADQIEKDYKKGGFKWLETGKKDRGILRPKWMWLRAESGGSSSRSISISSARTSYKLLGDVSAEEVNFDLKNGTLSALTISIWNKGDSDEITKAVFQSKITAVSAALGGRLGVKGKDLGKDQGSASRALRVRWENPETVAQLEYSSSEEMVNTGVKRQRQFVPEFIRLRLMPKSAVTMRSDAVANTAKVSVASLAARVKKMPNGDIYIDSVPMVDQGDKGYCAVASSERVMRYYGIQCDQHDLAQAAEASAGGTRPSDLEDALHKLQGKFKIRVRDLVKWDERDFERLKTAYNREAGKVGGKLWTPEDYFFEPNVDIFRDARCRNQAYEKFQKMVVEATNRGIPLLWALRLGLYPENGEKARQSGGGHMRTMLGYNLKTDELIFSDSWGAGHEVKRIKGRDAWAATLGLYLVEPQN